MHFQKRQRDRHGQVRCSDVGHARLAEPSPAKVRTGARPVAFAGGRRRAGAGRHARAFWRSGHPPDTHGVLDTHARAFWTPTRSGVLDTHQTPRHPPDTHATDAGGPRAFWTPRHVCVLDEIRRSGSGVLDTQAAGKGDTASWTPTRRTPAVRHLRRARGYGTSANPLTSKKRRSGHPRTRAFWTPREMCVLDTHAAGKEIRVRSKRAFWKRAFWTPTRHPRDGRRRSGTYAGPAGTALAQIR